MFEAAETGKKVDKEEYEKRVPGLRVDLINAQYDLREADFSLIIVVAGNDRLAVNTTVDVLNEWMDARFIQTGVFLPPSEEERERPRFWRFWRALPPAGTTGLFIGAWSLNTIAARLWKRIKKADFEKRLVHERQFERTLTDNGTLMVKFWLHTSEAVLSKRLDDAGKKRKKAWRVQDIDRDIYSRYKHFMPLAERYIRETDQANAPWQVVGSADDGCMKLKVGETILEALRGRLAHEAQPVVTSSVSIQEQETGILDSVDLSLTADYEGYRDELDECQRRLNKLSLKAREQGRSSVLVFEGWDAAGKGGVIRRITRSMSARDYQVIPIMAPTDEEKAHHYLWRFWRHLPRAGRMLIFDRSWYGRVLVERVEGFATEDEWRRSYAEINDFEAQLVERGILVQKFWLHVDPDEQLKRFKAREVTSYKKYKITEEDYRNREKREDYIPAVNEMVARTSTESARWFLVPANDKRIARLQVLRTVCDGLAGMLD